MILEDDAGVHSAFIVAHLVGYAVSSILFAHAAHFYEPFYSLLNASYDDRDRIDQMGHFRFNEDRCIIDCNTVSGCGFKDF